MKNGFLALALALGPVWGQAQQAKPQPRRPEPARAPSRTVVVEPYREPPRQPPRPSPPVVPEHAPAFSDYRLGAEDLISVSVLDSPEFSRPIRVDVSGTIRLPLVKQRIAAAGLTCAQLEAQIVRALVEEGLLREPGVSVTVQEFHSKPVVITGAVRAPLVFQAVRPLTLAEALSRAGGPTELAGPEIWVSRPRPDGQNPLVERVSLSRLMSLSDPSVNLPIFGGEEIRVPLAGRVFVAGFVQKPGPVMITEEQPLTLLQALAMAGGPAQNSGGKAFLLRAGPDGPQGREVAVNLKKLMQRKQPDVPLENNDLIFVPDSRGRRMTELMIASGITTALYGGLGSLFWR